MEKVIKLLDDPKPRIDPQEVARALGAEDTPIYIDWSNGLPFPIPIPKEKEKEK